MAEVHLIQWTVAFGGALWLTARWLLTRPGQRWRHIVAGLACTILWLPVAYTADNVHVADGGTTVAFGSQAFAAVSTFMVVVSLVGIVVGLLLWVEREAEDAHEALPAEMQPRPRRGD